MLFKEVYLKFKFPVKERENKICEAIALAKIIHQRKFFKKSFFKLKIFILILLK